METKRICPSCQKPLPPDVPLGLCPECLIKSGFNTGTEPGNPGKESGFVPPPVEELRKLFPQLEILELIGKGGMGAVYKARQLALDRLVALKILPPGASDDAGFAERFNREARALARLNHPHIVAVHDFGQAGGQPYLVMEFVDGPNLRQVEQTGRLTPEQALEIVPQICEALQFAHNEGIVHRDIKPENILLDKKGRVKITDFGIAKIVGVPAGKISLTGAKDVLGTPHYMAPEQVEKPATVDHRADIYSLGVVFYELLTGELPLGKFQPPSRKVQMDVRLDEVVLHALEKEPERRYQHASQVKTDVETIATTPSPRSSGRESAPTEDQSRLALAATIHNMVKAPANWLVATGILNWIAIPLVVLVTAGILAGKGTLLAAPMLLVPLSAMIFSSVMIVAGIKMKRLEAYPLAIIGSILAILVTPGNIIGLPVGIWSLVVLCRREVREAFGKGYSPLAAESPPPARGGDAWKIVAVITAAVLLVLAIPVGALLLAIGLPAFKARERARIVAAQNAAPPATALAVNFGPAREVTLNDLDESRGNEALSFASSQLLSLPADFGQRTAAARAGWLDSNRVDLLVDFARDRWGLMSRGLQFRDLPNEQWSEPDLGWGGVWPESEVLEKRENREGTLYLLPTNAQLPLTFAFLTARGDQGVLQITGLFTNDPRGLKLRYKLLQSSGGGGGGVTAAAPQIVAPEFGPVFERWVNGYGAEAGKQGLNFQSTALFSIPERQLTNSELRMKWLITRNIDLLVVNKGGFKWHLVGPDLKVARLSEGQWDLATPGELRRALATVEMEIEDGWPFHAINDRLEQPLTFAVQSGSGVIGLMQLTGYTERPRGVKLRYKLAQPTGGGGGGSATASAPDLRNPDADAIKVIVPNRYLAAALAGMDLAAEKIKDAAARGELSEQADVFNHFNELCDQLQGKNQNAPVTPQDWGIQDADKFKTITDSIAALEDASERMRDIARSSRRSKTEREPILKEAATQFVNRYAEFKARLNIATRSGGMSAADQDARRKFVRLVVDKTAMTFEGQPTSWDDVGALLAKVPDRKNTVLEFAVTSDQITVAQQNEWFQKASALARQHGFEYASFIGIHPLGLKGTSLQRGSPTFGLVMERTVSGEGDARRRFIDFETGRQFAASEFFGPKAEPSPEETQKWWRENSIDAMGDTGPAVSGLVGFDMVAVPVPLHEWDMTPARLDYYLTAAKPGTPATMSAKGDLPVTYVIQTREGGRGVLQITGFSGFVTNTRSVMIRYKLVQSADKPKRLSALLSEPDRSRALELFNDIEDFGHEFEAAFASTNLAAAETGVRRLLSLLTNFNTTVKGPDYQFPPALLGDIGKVRQALQEGDWSKARLLARHNEEYAREFRRISEEVANLARVLNARQPPPTNQTTATKLAAEKVAVEDLALRMVAAIRDKDDAVLKALAVDRIPGWREALPPFAQEMRERYRQMVGNERFDLRPGESLVEDDRAVVKCTGPKELGGTYLVLFFVKTADGWRNWSLRNSPPATPLAEHLKQRPPTDPTNSPSLNH